MASRNWRSGSSYADSTKQAIVLEIYRLPGRRGRAIAASLNLDRSRVNSFLHDEGKRYYGLRQIEYEWYPPVAIPSPPAPKPTPSPVTHPKSICRALSDLPLEEATLKIRSLSIEIVELVFADDDFNLLDDQLKAEFSIRRAELAARRPLEKTAPQSSNIWLLLAMISIMLSISVFVSNNYQRPDNHSPKPALNR
jgi:hypothetical protein